MRSRRYHLALLDAALINLSVYMALYLRFEGNIPATQLDAFHRAMPWFTLATLAVYAVFRLYSVILRYASINELLACASASVVSAGILWALTWLRLSPRLSRSAIIIAGVLQFILVGGLRLSVRLALRMTRYWWISGVGQNIIPVLIVGAGDAGSYLGREIVKGADPSRRLAGYIDDNPAKWKSVLHGVKVLGGRDAIPAAIRKLGIGEVIIAMPSAPIEATRDILKICQGTGVTVRMLPRLLDMAVSPSKLHMVKDIQLEDLLGRPEVKLDVDNVVAFLKGKRVLVTGAGGSIGSEICRQVARFQPDSILMLGHGENSIFEAKMALDREFPAVEKHAIIADVRDAARITSIFDSYRPQVVFHAAAHKHVPLMEADPVEAVKTNIFGTLNVARAALIHRAEKFILISSDKAVNPTSVMGATKRAAEMIVRALNAFTSDTTLLSVRFGNVLGSRGSVVPVFQQQIQAGGPVTVTHPEMRRYFMTIREAVQLVLQAAAMGHNDEVFVLDMGEPVKIVDLAEQMIRLSGFEPHKDIHIVFTGLRPGEKLFEEILTAEEGTVATRHSKIYVARQGDFSPTALFERLRQIEPILFPEVCPLELPAAGGFSGGSNGDFNGDLNGDSSGYIPREIQAGKHQAAPTSAIPESEQSDLESLQTREVLKMLKDLVPTYRGNRQAEG